MSVLSDKSIRKLAVEESMISPFVDKQVRDGKISLWTLVHLAMMQE